MENNFAPRGNKAPDPDPRDFVKGLTSDILYGVRKEDGDWTTDYMVYQPQKFKFDTNSCWCISGINCVEDQLDFLLRRGSFPPSSLQWFKDNGYLNDQNCFILSWRFIYALSGVYGNGNSQWNFWKLITKYGCPPRPMFDFTNDESLQYATQDDMIKVAGDASLVTPEMKAKGLEFLNYVSIQYEWTAPIWQSPSVVTLQAALKQSPQQIGVPACGESWNSTYINSWCDRVSADHAVELLKVDNDGTRHIYDQYHPEEKTLSANYPLYMVTNGVVIPRISPADASNVAPFPQNFITRLWANVVQWIKENYYY